MSQPTPGEWGLHPTGPGNGAQVAARANGSFNALLSSHSGNTAPGYAVAGTRWLDTSNGAAWAMKVYDGVDWNTEWVLNPTTGKFRLVGLDTPSVASDAATKGYVDGTSLHATTGYEMRSNGLIVQWGYTLITGGDATVVFPTAFPNIVYGVKGSVVAGSYQPSLAMSFNVDGITKTQFSGRIRSAANGGTVVARQEYAYWEARGK